MPIKLPSSVVGRDRGPGLGDSGLDGNSHCAVGLEGILAWRLQFGLYQPDEPYSMQSISESFLCRLLTNDLQLVFAAGLNFAGVIENNSWFEKNEFISDVASMLAGVRVRSAITTNK